MLKGARGNYIKESKGCLGFVACYGYRSCLAQGKHRLGGQGLPLRAMNLSILGFTLPFVLAVDTLGVVGFTAMGIGPRVYNFVADASMNQAGNGAAAVTGLYLALLFILDYHRMPLGLNS